MSVKSEKNDWNLIVQRESARVEWKENVANPQNVVKTLSAFANDFQQVGGGRVLCGLKEEKNQYGEQVAKVVGLDEKRLKEVKNKVLDFCHRYVEPPLTPVVNDYPVESDPSRRILVFAVTGSKFAHRYRIKKEDVNYYIRINDETKAANGLIPQLLERKQVWPPYVDQSHPEAGLDAIDLLVLKEFLGRLELPHPVEKYLEPDIRFRGDVQCLVTHPPGGSHRVVPRNFTVLLFGRDPHWFFRGAYAIFSVYRGTTRTAARSQRFMLYGPIPAVIRNLMARLQLFMGMDIDTGEDGLNGRPNRWRYSEQAVKEAIVNAFVHRDYHSYDPIRVTIFSDRIEILNPGGPNAPIDIEKISEGEVYTSWRNPSLAWFMVELEFAQNEGKGIRAIVEATKSITGKKPKFTIDNHWFRVDIPAFNPLLDVGPGNSEGEDVKETPSVVIDLRFDLPVIRTDFDVLNEILAPKDAKLERELYKIEDSLDGLNFESDRKELIKPFNKLGRLLGKLADNKSPYHKLLEGKKESIFVVQKLSRGYNRFAQWLALPQVPEI